MADLNTLQELHILTTGKMANTTVLASLEASANANGYTQIDQTINTSMNAQEAIAGKVAMYQTVARQGLGLDITAAQATKAAADFQAAGIDTWAKVLHWLAGNQTTLTTALDNRAEAAMHFRAELIERGNSGLFSGVSIDAAASNVIQGVGASAQSLAIAKQAMAALAGKLGPGGISAQLADGYYASAVVHADTNGNFFESPGEWGALVSDVGTFTIPANATTGRLIATGGVDFLTDRPWKGVMTAPSGSSIISPLTTLVQSLLDAGHSMPQAIASVRAALGLAATVDVMTYEPRRVLLSTTASAQEKAAALSAEKAILQVSNTTTQIGNAIDAAATNDAAADRSFDVYTALAAVVHQRGSAGLTLDLTDASVIASLIAASNTSGSIAGSAARLTQIVDASNTAIAAASNGLALAKAAVVTQGDVVAALITAMDNNTLDATVTAYTGANLDARIAVAQPGEIIPGVEITLVGSPGMG